MRWVKVMVIVMIAGFALVGMLGTLGVGVGLVSFATAPELIEAPVAPPELIEAPVAPPPPVKGSDVLLWVNPPLTSIEVRPGVLQDIVLGLKAAGAVVWGKGALKKVPSPTEPPEAHVEDQKAAKTPWYKGWFGSK